MLLLINVLLFLAALLYIVPAVTDGGVAIRRASAVRGVLALLVIALLNNIFWHASAIAFAGLQLSAPILTMALVAWVLNSLAIFVTGRVMPGVLWVRNFGAAMGASLTLIIFGWLVSAFLL